MLVVRCNRCGAEVKQGSKFGTISMVYRTGFSKDSDVASCSAELKNSHFCESCMKDLVDLVLDATQFNSNTIREEGSIEVTKNQEVEKLQVKSKTEPEKPENYMGLPLPYPLILKVIKRSKFTISLHMLGKDCNCAPPTAKRIIEKCVPARDALMDKLSKDPEYSGFDIPQIFSFIENNWGIKEILYEVPPSADVNKVNAILKMYDDTIIDSLYNAYRAELLRRSVYEFRRNYALPSTE